MPNQVSLKTKLTNKIELNIPILSAAMDTVTESDLAIAMARVGGIGIIHKNLSIAEQALEVQKGKRNESGFITDPITIGVQTLISEAKSIMSTYRISGLPVVNEENQLIGIVTNRDLKYLDNDNALVKNIMTTKNLIVGDKTTTIEQAKQVMLKNKIEKLPIVGSNNKLIGLITTKDIDKAIDYPNACKDDQGWLRVGVVEDTLARVEALVKAKVDVLVVDSAHGHSLGILKTVKIIRKTYPKLDIIAGNICTAAGAQALYEAGANCIKVGVGPGSICTTRNNSRSWCPTNYCY
nr:IMP dehydrogenase [Spiroplasma ixodetis]